MDERVVFRIRTPEDLGRTIAAARRISGRDQSDLGAAVGVSASYVSKIEQGRSSRLLTLVLDLVRELDLEIIIRPRTPGG